MKMWRAALLLAVLTAVTAGPGTTQRRTISPEERQGAEAAVARFTSPTLTRFADDAEFRAYVEAVADAARARGDWWAHIGLPQFAQAQGGSQTDAVEPVCPPENPDCLETPDDGEGSVIITGARSSPSNPSITNNQMAGVEEGDIVKQIDHFLLILQDGRIFVVDTRARGRSLALADRMNVYRDDDDDIWYDEMLVFGDRVLVTGYSYGEDATELSVFRLSPAGRLSREGVFYVSSDDYYSTTNYATRLIGDRLVIYTPFSVRAIGSRYFRWPVVRRWLPEENRSEAIERGKPLFDAVGIYRPVRDLFDPVVHSVSVCPLGQVGPAGELDCRTSAFVGPAEAQWYVSDDDAYLWTHDGWRALEDVDRDCVVDEQPGPQEIVQALLYRVPVEGGQPGVIAGRGVPVDQFSLQAGDGRFRALLIDRSRVCRERWETPVRLSYFDVALDSLGPRIAEPPATSYVPLPGTGTRWIANRFTDRYLVYGGLSRYRSGLPEFDETEIRDEDDRERRRRALAMPPAFAVPVNRPRDVRRIDIRQTVIRAERVGNDIAVTGYRDRGGLRVTLIDLDGVPRIASSALLPGRFESEGRSHAFNSLVERDDSGLLGLPTVRRIAESNRFWWRSRASDLSYLAFDSDGALTRLGELESHADDEGEDPAHPGYTCEVSCIDWYGNSRPIFTDGRIFALTGTELVEGRIRGERIDEIRRLDLTAPPRR